MLLGDFEGKIGLRPIFPNIVGRCYLYATLPCPPYRTGPTYATGPRSARVNTLGAPRFARNGHCVPAQHATHTHPKQVKNRSKRVKIGPKNHPPKRSKMGQNWLKYGRRPPRPLPNRLKTCFFGFTTPKIGGGTLMLWGAQSSK